MADLDVLSLPPGALSSTAYQRPSWEPSARQQEHSGSRVMPEDMVNEADRENLSLLLALAVRKALSIDQIIDLLVLFVAIHGGQDMSDYELKA